MSETNRILLIGTLPPPITGQSVAFQLLKDGLISDYQVATVNISDVENRRDKSFAIGRMGQVVRHALDVLKLAHDQDLIYLTIAQSRLGFFRDAMIIYAARFVSKAPIVVHLHGGNYYQLYDTGSSFFRFMMRQVLAHVDRFIVLSEPFRCQFDFLNGPETPTVEVVPNGADVEIKEARCAPTNELNLLFLSNLIVEKGYLDCVDAVPLLQRLLPDIRIKMRFAGSFVLGVDDYEDTRSMVDAFHKHVKYLNVEYSVEYLGVVSGKDKEMLLKVSDILLLPSYYTNEGQPICVIEAMATGQPVISTSWRALKELVDDGVTGIHVPPKDPLSIAEAVARIYRTKGLYEQMSSAALKRYMNFSPALHLERMKEVFDRTIMGERPNS